jgi:hypothetical protein
MFSDNPGLLFRAMVYLCHPLPHLLAAHDKYGRPIFIAWDSIGLLLFGVLTAGTRAPEIAAGLCAALWQAVSSYADSNPEVRSLMKRQSRE